MPPIFAVYALRERALLLGLQPTKGASTFSLPDAKPTPRPRADAAESMLPLTEDLPQLTLVRMLALFILYCDKHAELLHVYAYDLMLTVLSMVVMCRS